MFKHKVIFPDKVRHQSPYQLEDCKRRIGYLKHELQPIVFQKINDNTIQFRIRRIKSQRIPFPMVAFEITGTLRRWGGTGTIIEDYRLKRFSMNVDTWVALFVSFSAIVAAGLMLPALIHTRLGMVPFLLIFTLVMVLLPLILWIQHILTLNSDRDIDEVHQTIMTALDIE